METRYYLSFDKTDQLLQSPDCKHLFDGYDNVVITSDSEKINVYSKALAMIFLSNNFEFENMETKQPETIKTYPLLTAYCDGYKNGINEFDLKYKISPEVLFSNNADAIVRNLIRKGFGDETTLIFGQWQTGGWEGKAKNKFYLYTNEIVKSVGYYSGLHTALNDFMNEYPTIFEKYIKETIMISIEAIEKHLETITEINQKIIYLINTKAEHEKYVATLPESAKKWLGDNVFSKQCDALIAKYELLLKYQTAPALNRTTTELICDKKHLQKLHAEFDGKVWESVELETFLNYMRIEPIGQIEIVGKNKIFAKWLRDNIENNRDAKVVPNFGKWFIKLIGKNINYSTFFSEY